MEGFVGIGGFEQLSKDGRNGFGGWLRFKLDGGARFNDGFAGTDDDSIRILELLDELTLDSLILRSSFGIEKGRFDKSLTLGKSQLRSFVFISVFSEQELSLSNVLFARELGLSQSCGKLMRS